MKLLFLVLCLWQDCLKIDIILVGDFSGSVRGKEAFIQAAFNSFIQGLPLSEDGVRLGVVVFSDNAEIVQHLTSERFQLDSLEASGTTNLSEALQLSLDEFNRNGRDVRKIIILISDGIPDDPDGAKLIASQLKLVGVGICGILVEGGNNEYMQEISSVYAKSNYENLLEQIKQLSGCL